MKLITKTRVRRALIPLAALAVAAAIVPTAGAADCAMKPGANCAGMDLRGHNMNGMALHAMNLAGANMSGMTVTGANLAGANMKGADMRGTTMRKMTMKGADMSKANLTGSTVIGGNWSKAKMMHSKLGGITVSKTNMSNVDFSHASNKFVRGANPTVRSFPSTRQAASAGSVFSGVNLSGAQFINTTMQNAMFVNSTRFQWTQMKHSNFSGSTFMDATFFETFSMRESNMSNTSILGTTWAPVFLGYMNFDNMTCNFVNVPADRQVFGTADSDSSLLHFSGQNAQAQGQVSYGDWTIITPSYDWYFEYALRGADPNPNWDYYRVVSTSAANASKWPGGCAIVGINTQ